MPLGGFLFDWLKGRSATHTAKNRSEASLPGGASAHATRAFRLEPLEPRVLLSADAIAVALSHQLVENTQPSDQANEVVAIVEQISTRQNLDAAGSTAGQSTSAPSVQWAQSWQISQTISSKTEPASPVATTETASTGSVVSSQTTAPSASSSQSNASPYLADTQNSETVPLFAEGGNAAVSSTPSETQQPRGPPADGQTITSLVSENSIQINDLAIQNSSTQDAGMAVSVATPPNSEPTGDSLARAPPVSLAPQLSQPEYLVSSSNLVAGQQS